MARHALLVLAAALAWSAPPVLANEEGDATRRLEFSGYYKTLLTRSDTLLPVHDAYAADLNRLRLELQGPLLPDLALDLQYDNEAMLGDYLDTPQFQAQMTRKDDRYWDLDKTYADRDDVFARHRLYRASLTWSQGNTDVRMGRQRIALGTGRFFSPLDRINPVAPNLLERDERPGVDALLVEHKLGPLARATAFYVPGRDRDSGALQWHANAAAIDWSLIAGRFRDEDMAGGDIATQLGEAGLRAEVSWNRPDQGEAYQRGVIGLDYAFANTLTVSGEYYYNGAGAGDKRFYNFLALLDGRVLSLARDYAGVYASYELTPLLKSTNALVFNLDDGSRYFSPELTYSVRQNLDVTAGLQSYGGSAGSEFGFFRQVLFAQLQYFF